MLTIPFCIASTGEGSSATFAGLDVYLCSGGQTRVVGVKAADALGLHDMLGSVWDWVADGYGKYDAGAQSSPGGLDGSPYRSFRGGAFGNAADLNRASSRIGWTPNASFLDIGFRVAHDP